MRLRQITMEDGRYLIFYTFDGEAAGDEAPATAARGAGETPPREEPETTNEAGEERRV
ncbi:MAG: hypothetical protein ACRD9R_13465 [Pyrinomonadaceae bacterium]